jgi:hypothetical protein
MFHYSKWEKKTIKSKVGSIKYIYIFKCLPNLYKLIQKLNNQNGLFKQSLADININNRKKIQNYNLFDYLFNYQPLVM